MKVLFDTNVVLDVMLDREPFVTASEEILSRAESGELAGVVGATTVTTIHYLAAKTVGAARALTEVHKLLAIFEIAPVNRPVLEGALSAGFSDFEDAVLYEAARQVGAQAIVSRDRDDFKRATLPVYSPAELLKVLELRKR